MIQVSWSGSGELQLNYDDCVKLMKVKKIHNFMLNDFREIISQHHNMPQVAVLPMDSAVFVQICQIKCVV